MNNYEVFISHSHKDKAIADAICHYFEDEKIKCWIAPRDIKPGTNWAEAIAGAIPNCRIFLLIFSSHANMSHQVLREVELAVQEKLIIVPVKTEDIMPTGGMKYYLSTVHWIDVVNTKTDKYIKTLADTVKSYLDAKEKLPISVGKSYASKKKRIPLAIWISVAAVVILAVLGFAFRDSLFGGANESSDVSLNQPTEIIDITAEPTEEPTPSPTIQVEQDIPPITFFYNYETDIITMKIFTDYSEGTIFVNKIPIETEQIKRIENMVHLEFSADLINLNESMHFSILLEHKDKDDLVIVWSNFFFSNGNFDVAKLHDIPFLLEYVILVGDGITGDINELADLHSLRGLELYDCNIEGDIAAIENIATLERLTIAGNENISGNINFIRNFSDLSHLKIKNNSIIFNLENVSNLSELKSLWLEYCPNVTGNISNLAGLSKLELLAFIVYSGVYGNISDLKDLESINTISMWDVDGIEGDIASFASLESLYRIDFGECDNLYGDLEDLSTLENLQYLQVSVQENIIGSLVLPSGETVTAN